jgi:hypothetical protein
MPSSIFTPTSAVVSGSVTSPNSSWINLSHLYDSSGASTRTAIQLQPDAETNYLIVKGFGSEIPAGTLLSGVRFNFNVSLDSVSDSANVSATEIYLQINGIDYGPNLAETEGYLSDFGYGDGYIGGGVGDYLVEGLDLLLVEDSSFGIKLKIKNINTVEYYYAYINSVTLELFYTTEFPKFIYNGDTTSEVNVTLDLNPAVTNPTTTFGIYHGNDTNLITRNPTAVLSYTEYNLYTEPDTTSPDPTFIDEINIIGTGVGSYPENYLSTTIVDIVRGVSGLWGSDTTTSHTMSYVIDNLVKDNTYRRGLVLWYKAADTSGNVLESGVYDILYFNLTVIDTSDLSIYPHFIYNGDSTSEVTITLDKNINVTNPTTSFYVYHGDPDTTSTGANAGYHWGAYYSEPNLNDPDGGFVELITVPGYGDYETNYLITDERSTLTETFTLHTLTSVIMDYDTSELIAGNSYRRAIVLWNIRVPNGKIYDILYFNINVIDTTIPQYPKFVYSGDTTSEVYVTLDLNLDSTNPTTEFGIYHGDADTISQYTAFGYRWGNLNSAFNIINAGSTGKFTPPNVGDPDYADYIGVLVSPPMGLYYTNNILQTEFKSFAFSSRVGPYCCYNTTTHIMEYDTSGLIAGETYRRGMGLENTRSYPLASQGKLYDTLFFNIEVIDTTPTPEIIHPFLMYNGDTTAEVFVTIDLNPNVSLPTTTFAVYRGDPDTTSSGTDLGYTWGQYFTDDGTSAHSSWAGNYLSTPTVSSSLSDGTVTEHTMSYLPIDSIELIVGETYRRGLVLWNIRSTVSKLYDILWFNINVVDTSLPRRRPAGSYSNLLI